MFEPMFMPQFVFSGYDSDGLVGGALDGGANPADKEKFYLVASGRIGPKVRGINVGDFRAQRFEDVSHFSFAPLPLQLALSVMKKAYAKEPVQFRQLIEKVDPNTLIQRIHNSIPGNAQVGGISPEGNAGAIIFAKEWKDTVNAAYYSTKRKPKGFDPSFQRGRANCRTGGNAEFCWDIKLTKKMRNPNVYHKREKDLFDKCRDILDSAPSTAADRDENVQAIDELIQTLNARRAELQEINEFDQVAEEGGVEEEEAPAARGRGARGAAAALPLRRGRSAGAPQGR